MSTTFRPLVYSRHPSHAPLRELLPRLPFRSMVRLGSVTDRSDAATNGGGRVELNTVESIRNSASKLRMKRCFQTAGVATADWCLASEFTHQFSFPVVAKSFFGSKGRGNTLLHSRTEYDAWAAGKDLSRYLVERFYNYSLEFRLHVSRASGCFYANRKALRRGVAVTEAWRRHDDVCVWLKEGNPEFNKPNSWADIEAHCVRALEAVGADILSFDVRVQGNSGGYQKFILLECNSASSLGEVTLEHYLQEIPKVLAAKVAS